MSTPAYLTVNEAAPLLNMTPGGVRKAISDGRLRAIKRSERKILVPRTVIEAYHKRLNGGGPAPQARAPLAPLAERVEEFEQLTGLDPAEWLRRWRADPERDDLTSMREAIAALAIEVERQGESASVPERAPVLAMAAFTSLDRGR